MIDIGKVIWCFIKSLFWLFLVIVLILNEPIRASKELSRFINEITRENLNLKYRF